MPGFRPLVRHMPQHAWKILAIGIAVLPMTACSVIAVADAAVTVAATTVKVGATVVGTTVDVAAAGVKAVVGSDEDGKE